MGAALKRQKKKKEGRKKERKKERKEERGTVPRKMDLHGTYSLCVIPEHKPVQRGAGGRNSLGWSLGKSDGFYILQQELLLPFQNAVKRFLCQCMHPWATEGGKQIYTYISM